MTSDRLRAGKPKASARRGSLLSHINARVEPRVRAGFGSPGLLPAGLIVLETTGRRSGRTYRTPLLASRAPGGYLWVSTVLGRHANWLRNARANPGVRYWVKGRLHEGQAIVAAPGMAAPALDALPQSLRWLAKRGIDASLLLGFGVLIIIPSHPAP